MIPVEGYRGLYRDENSGAIINCNQEELHEYLKSKEFYKNERNELIEIKNELEELKSLVKKIIESKI